MTTTRTRRGEYQRAVADRRLVDALRTFAADGATRPELAGYLGFDPSSGTKVGQRLRRLVAEGRIGVWPDPLPNSRMRVRYWAAEFLPATCPPPSGKHSTGGAKPEPLGVSVAAHRTGPLDRPWATLPAGYCSVIDSAQCRPWASAAAACIGAEHAA